jgi:hypothetical protein
MDNEITWRIEARVHAETLLQQGFAPHPQRLPKGR